MSSSFGQSGFLITGASSGLGQALSRVLVNRGLRVWGIARRGDLLEKLKRELPMDRFFYSVCDVTSPDDVRAVLRSMDSECFSPNVAILNAGVNTWDLDPEFNFAQCEYGFRVNLFGALIWVDQLLPRFFREGRGHFVAISSMSAYRATAQGISYSASKAALSMAFESLRLRYHSMPIRFTTVHLGPTDTPMWPGGKFPFLLSPENAARRIIAATERGGEVYNTPAFIVLLARLSGFLPRKLFIVSEQLLRHTIHR